MKIKELLNFRFKGDNKNPPIFSFYVNIKYTELELSYNPFKSSNIHDKTVKAKYLPYAKYRKRIRLGGYYTKHGEWIPPSTVKHWSIFPIKINLNGKLFKRKRRK